MVSCSSVHAAAGGDGCVDGGADMDWGTGGDMDGGDEGAP